MTIGTHLESNMERKGKLCQKELRRGEMQTTAENEHGFTLIELLTTIMTMGALAGIVVQSYRDYTAKAAYGVAADSVRNARTSYEASQQDPDSTYPSIAMNQNSAGPISDPAARELLAGFVVSDKTAFQVTHEPGCIAGGCIASFIQVNHCRGKEYVSWTRFGDGSEVLLEHVAGEGC